MSSRAGPSNPAPVRPNRTLMDQEANLVAQIARLSTEDVEALHSRRHGQITDGELAFRLAAEEAQALSAFERDRALAMRLSMHEDKEITTGLETFGKGHVAMRLPTNTVSREDVAKAPAPVQRLTGHNCAICMDPIRGVEIRAPCGDFYDKACILELFQAATRDEALFPPRCCRQNIPLESVRPYMGAALVRLFEEKKVEFGTLKRVYCANQACSRFLGAQIESSFKWWFRRMYTCSCGTGTCTWCKEKFDTTDHHCNTEADRQDQVVLALGEQSGWARCPGCGQLIELNLGCFHMTCRCRTEFCYVCKALWKTCACPQWDERRLLAAAEARVDAEMGHHAAPRRPPAPPPRAHPLGFDARPARPVVQPDARPARPAAHDAYQARPAQAVPPRPVITQPRLAQPPVQPAVRPAVQAVRLMRPAQTIPHPLAIAQPNTQPAERQPPSRPAARPVENDIGTTITDAAASSSRQTAQVRSPSAPASNVPHASPSQASKGKRVERPGNAGTRATRVQEWMERLREDHDCDHTKWAFRKGGGRCEMCSHNLPQYLFRCRGCAMLACNRCRKNRI